MKHLTFALMLLLGAFFLFNMGLGSPVPGDDEYRLEGHEEWGGRKERGGGGEDREHHRRPTCSPVTITRTITKHQKTYTTTITSTPNHCMTTTTTSDTSTTSIAPTGCSACGSECPSPAAVTITKTLDWEDIDGTAASRVPIPFNYNGFSHYNPDQNKVYRSGPPPVSVGNGSQVMYANDGKFGLGAQGFVIVLRSFWVLTFLDPANGLTSATVRVSGPLVGEFTQTITVDRQFVQIVAPVTQSNTAVGFFIEIFKGDTVGGERLPAWIDDIIYERNIWPATCCQRALDYNILNFDDITSTIPFPYNGFQFQGGWEPVTLVDFASQGTVLKFPLTAPQPASIANPTTPFTLTCLSVFIPQATDPGLGQNKQTVITLTGYDSLGTERPFGWSVPAVTFQPGLVKIDLGRDWTQGRAGPPTGFFAAVPDNGFKGIQELRIKVEEVDFRAGGVGTGTPLEFWLDDFQYQITC